ncbi:FAS1 domain-containing protein [Bisporella sp. PMI_857]|nr:FAS1 domain-containing protein [Bisporella sp. PMI_857]
MADLPASLISTLQSNSRLSTLNSYINSSAKLSNLLSSSTNFTFLAPSNDAFAQWISSQGNQTDSMVEAALSYHLLNGSFPTVSFSNEPQFAPTYLTNQSYSNVTISPGGQRVEFLKTSGGDPEFVSSNKTVSTIASRDIICLGGLIHVINTVLSMPIALVTVTAQANMEFFIAILNKANFLSVDNTGLINFVNIASFTPNMTFFVPNTAEALDKFTNISTGLSAENLTALFNYHIVPDFVGYSSSLANGTALKTAEGSSLTITRQGSDIYVNSAKIINPDYLIVNGVIHVIDSLLDRFNTTIPPQNSTTTSATLTPTTTAVQSNNGGLSTGAKAGVGVSAAIGGLLFLALVAFTFLYRKRKLAAAQKARDDIPEPPAPPVPAAAVQQDRKHWEKPELQAPLNKEERAELESRRVAVELEGGGKLNPVELEGEGERAELEARRKKASNLFEIG